MLEAVTSDIIVKDIPISIGVFDNEMCYINCSDLWLKELGMGLNDVLGKSLYEITPNVPEEIKQIHQECLLGACSKSSGERFIDQNGNEKWYSWKMSPWKRENGEIGGIIIVTEEVTKERNDKDLQSKALSVAKIGGWEVDMESNTVFWTDITKEIHGVSKEYVPNLEEGINFYKEGKSRDTIMKLVSDAIQNGTPWDTELQIITLQGEDKWVRAIGQTEVLDGKCVRLMGTFQDIDDRKKAEIEYQKVSERLRVATSAAVIGIWDFDIINNNLIWDDNMYHLYGIKKEDFSGVYEAWEASVHQEDQERAQKEVEDAIKEGKEFNTEFRVVLPSGDIRNIKAIAHVERNAAGESVKMIGANWDITDFKHTKLKLLKSEESFSGAFDNSAVGMALVDIDGKWLKVNDSICESLGYTEKELMGLTFQDITHPEDLMKDLVLLNELIAGERDNYQIEKRYFHKNGDLVYVILSVTSVMSIDGKLSHFISQILDITSRKEAENKLKSMLELTSGQNDSLTNFAHIVSHNLRSHSTNLSMLTGFLKEEQDENEKKQLVNMLHDSSESLGETIHHLNEVVNINANVTQKLEPVNLSYVIKNVMKTLSIGLNSSTIECKIDVPVSQSVRAVPAYMDSILLNLFTNAIKYRSPDRDLFISVSSESNENKVVVKFSDNGLGIDLEKHRKKLFGMYKTFHKHKEAKGIGLFITKNQMEAMNGKINVESKVDEGTTFTLIFDK